MTIKIRDGEIYLTRDGKKAEGRSDAVREAGVL